MLRRFSGYRTTTGETITLVKLDKSGGCVDRDDEFMRQTREAAIREYFFGDPKRTLSPHTQQVNFDDATIYKIREGKICSLKVLNPTNVLQQIQCWRRFFRVARRIQN
jgi:polyribonucleotide 5'-hydroxyl-kinase